MEQKNSKNLFIFKIFLFEQDPQILIFSNKILVIGSQYVTKQPKDLTCR